MDFFYLDGGGMDLVLVDIRASTYIINIIIYEVSGYPAGQKKSKNKKEIAGSGYPPRLTIIH